MTETKPATPPPARDPTLEEAALAYAKAKKAVDRWTGEKRGAEFAALLVTWRAAMFDLNAASLRHANSQEPA